MPTQSSYPLKQSRSKRFRDSVAAPGVVVFALALLSVIALMVSITFENEIKTLVYFAITCLVVFHFFFWIARDDVTDKTLKIVEYIYLGMGFFGIVGVLDVQAQVAKERMPSIVKLYTKTMKDNNPCTDGVTGANCVWPNLVMEVMEREVPSAETFDLLESFSKVMLDPKSTPKNYMDFYEQFRALHESLKFLVFPHLSDVASTGRKYLAYYFLCIGISLRLTKVSAELFNWKKAPVKPAARKRSAWLLKRLTRNRTSRRYKRY